MSGFNKYQQAMLAHLSEPNRSSDVASDLQHFVVNGFFLPGQSEQASIINFNQIVARNERNWCKEGIQRARDALGIPEPKKEFKVGNMVTYAEAKTLPNGSIVAGINSELSVVAGNLVRLDTGRTVYYFVNDTKREILHIQPSKK